MFKLWFANKFEKKFECLNNNTEKYKKFSVPTEYDITKFYETKFIDSAKSLATSLSHLVTNLTEGIHNIKCKDCYGFLNYESTKENSIKYKCKSRSKDYSNKNDKELKRRFKNIFNNLMIISINLFFC